MIELDRDRLAKLLGMMGSAHDGEALNAARMAHTLVRQAGMTWEDVLRKVGTLVLPAPRPVPVIWRRSRAGNPWATLYGAYVVVIARDGRYSVGHRTHEGDDLEWASGFTDSGDAQAWAECFLRDGL